MGNNAANITWMTWHGTYETIVNGFKSRALVENIRFYIRIRQLETLQMCHFKNKYTIHVRKKET